MKLKRTTTSGYRSNNKGAGKKRNINQWRFYATHPQVAKMALKSEMDENTEEFIKKMNKIQKIGIRLAIAIVIVFVLLLVIYAASQSITITYNGERIK